MNGPTEFAGSVLLAVVSATVAAPLLLMPWVAPSDAAFENRVRARLPAMEATRLLDVEFYAAIDRAWTDALPLRGELVRLAMQWQYQVLGDVPVERVFVGRDGWIFDRSAFTEPAEVAESERRLLVPPRMLAATCARAGIEFRLVIGPNKSSLYPQQLGPVGELLDAVPRARRAEHLRALEELPIPGYIDLRSEVLAAMEGETETIFPPTGRHWDGRGGWLATASIIRSFDPEGLLLADARPQITTREVLAEIPLLMMNLEVPIPRDGYALERPGVSCSLVETLAFRGVPRVRVFRARSDDAPLLPGRTVIVHDSGLEASVPFLQQFFEELVLVQWDVLARGGECEAMMRDALDGARRLVLEVAEDRRGRRFVQLDRALPIFQRILARGDPGSR